MFISSAYAQSGSQTQGGDPTFLLLMMVGLFVFMYFTTIRPQRKRQKEHSELINSLSQGHEILLSSGLMGKIVKLSDLYVVINVAEKVDLKFQRTHVTAVLPKGTIKTLGA
jgi:preprotein translocase subunit YajC